MSRFHIFKRFFRNFVKFAQEDAVTEKSTYQLFMVRFWHEENDQKMIWRCRVKDVRTGQEIGFTSPDDLWAFLQKQMPVDSSSSHPERNN